MDTASTQSTEQSRPIWFFKTKCPKLLKRFWAYCGPGYMVAVGYMDPGNWATGIEAGSRYGYQLLWVILASNLMAMVLQHLCVRMGLTMRQDLAQACRCRCPRWLSLVLYVFAEIAMISTDLAEVIGTAIALRMLFGIPIIIGVLLTVADVLLLLGGLSSARSYRILEIIVMVLMSVIGICFFIQMAIVKPSISKIAYGFIPTDFAIFREKEALFAAIGIIGATVMPHNLYLHSAIVQQSQGAVRRIAIDSIDIIDTDDSDTEPLVKQVAFATADTMIALILALLVNAAILIVAAAAFHERGERSVRHIEEAAELMRQWLGPASYLLFALALLAAGQSSAVTGTIAGQVVFEGFLQLRLAPWLRRLITRSVAIVPALLIVIITGEASINRLLLFSQVILSFQLPFAIIPLIIFTFSPPTPEQLSNLPPELATYWESRMGSWLEALLKWTSWAISLFILIMNVLLVATMLAS